MSIGRLFIISAPSGAGKTSLVKRLLAEMQELIVSTSHTTRSIRPGEIHGQDYYFVSVESFEVMLKQQAFLEYAKVFDNFYGTEKAKVTQALSLGIDVILEIDWQGAQQIKTLLTECISIFILPPSIEVLQQRLTNRGQDSQETIARRMRDAMLEMSHYNEFDYLIVNDVFEQALFELKSIIVSYRLQRDRQREKLQPLLDQLIC